MARTVTIRQGLLRSLTLLVVFVSAATLGVTYIGSSRVVEKLTKALMARTNEQTAAELRALFTPVQRSLALAHSWGEEGLLRAAEADDVRRLNALFIPVLEHQPQITSLQVANSEGYEYLLLRESGPKGQRWYNRIMWVDRWGKRAYWLRWSNASTLVARGEVELAYDPRPRPWYRESLQSRSAVGRWTDPYMFFTSKVPGMTVGSSWRDGGTDYVVAFDVTLIDISRFTTKMRISAHGAAFVISGDERVIGLPRDQRFAKRESFSGAILQPARALGIPIMTKPLRKRHGNGDELLRFEHHGQDWWVGFRRFLLGERTLWIGVAVPESDFTGEVRAQQIVVWLIALGSLLGAIVIAFLLARSYGRPLEALARQSTRIGEFDLSESEPVPSRLAEVSQLARAQAQMLSALRSFARYVPVELVRQLVRRGEVAQIGGRSCEMTVLFTDIRGFTSIAELLSPEALTAQMSEYFAEILAELHAHDATVDKFIGDAVMAFWGAPRDDAEHARHSVEAVVRCRERLDRLNQRWQERGLPAMETCFGLNTGAVVVGNIGAPDRLSYTVLGDAVNLASRLESLCRHYSVATIVSGETRAAAGSGFEWRRLDRVVVKGKQLPVDIHEVLGRQGDVAPEVLKAARSYEAALERYQAGDFAGASAILAEPELATDPPSDRLRALCQKHAAKPKAEWTGVTQLTEK